MLFCNMLFTCSAKSKQICRRPQLHAAMCLVHGVGQHWYLCDTDMPKDSNLQLTMMNASLDKAVKNLRKKGLTLPRNLCFHVDMSPKGNRYISIT